MNSTVVWWNFWTLCFVLAGGSFALIAMIVAWRGLGDLRKLVAFLREKHI